MPWVNIANLRGADGVAALTDANINAAATTLTAARLRTDPGVAGADYQHTAYLGGAPTLADAQYLDARLAGVRPATVNNAAAFTALLALGRPVFLGAGTLVFGSAVTIPANAIIKGSGRGKTILSHAFAGDFADLGHNATLEDLTVEGNGATYTGRGLTIRNDTGKQKLNRVEIINFDGPCLYFEVRGGSQFAAIQSSAYRINAGTGTGRYAVVVDPVQQLAAYPKAFTQFNSEGNCAFDFGGGNNLYIGESTIADLRYTADSRAILISATRMLNQAALTVNGHNNCIVGCDVFPQITIAAGAQSNVVGPNTYNNLPVIDNSANATNTISHRQVYYNPTVTSGGTAPSIGNGTVEGFWQRDGGAVTLTVELTMGTTTSLGTGDVRFALPTPHITGTTLFVGTGTCTIGAVRTFVTPLITGGSSYLTLMQDGAAGQVTYNSPGVFAAGDSIRITITYLI